MLMVLLQSSIGPIMPSESPLGPHNASLVPGTLQDLSRGVQKGSQKRSKIGHFRGLDPDRSIEDPKMVHFRTGFWTILDPES